MAGLDPLGCLLRPEDYKDADALKSCIYRSFIHHPLMWLLIDRADATAPALVVLCPIANVRKTCEKLLFLVVIR